MRIFLIMVIAILMDHFKIFPSYWFSWIAIILAVALAGFQDYKEISHD